MSSLYLKNLSPLNQSYFTLFLLMLANPTGGCIMTNKLFVCLFFSATEPDGMHVIIDRHLITGQNDTSTLSAVQNLILLCNARLDSNF